MVRITACNQCGCSAAASFSVTADSCKTFCIAIGGPNSDVGGSIIQTTDGGYAITGYTDSYGQGGKDVYIIKLDINGNIQWTRTIGGPGNDVGNAIVQTADSGYIIVGSTTSFGQGSWDIYVVKIDNNGNLQWTKTIGGTDRDVGRSVVQTSDGGYAIVGHTYSFGGGIFYNIYVIKLSANGTIQWTRTIGGTYNDYGLSIVQTSDNGYVITGHGNSHR